LHLGLLPPFLRRHPLPAARSQPRHRTAPGARFEPRRAGGESRDDRLVRSEAVVKRLVVGAHYGMRDWLAQRITAAIMVVYSLIAVVVLAQFPPVRYAGWKHLFEQGWMRVATLLFAVSLAWHAWVGVRDILMDYIKPDGLRLGLQVLTILVLAGYVGWTVQVLWR